MCFTVRALNSLSAAGTGNPSTALWAKPWLVIHSNENRWGLVPAVLAVSASTYLVHPGLPSAVSLCWKQGQGWLSEIIHWRGEKPKVRSYPQDCPTGGELCSGTKTENSLGSELLMLNRQLGLHEQGTERLESSPCATAATGVLCSVLSSEQCTWNRLKELCLGSLLERMVWLVSLCGPKHFLINALQSIGHERNKSQSR